MRTPIGVGMNQTPSLNLRNVDAAAIQRAAAGLPSSVYNTLAQVAGNTPAAGNQYQSGNFNAGYGASFNYQVWTPFYLQQGAKCAKVFLRHIYHFV